VNRPSPIAKRDVDAAIDRAKSFVSEAYARAASIETVLSKARAFVALVHGEADLEKSLWGSPAGKRHLAKRIVAAIPQHRVYIEPFAGGAQVFWAKEPSEVEVLADRDPDIAFAFRFVKSLTSAKLATLKRKSWIGDADRFKRLLDSSPEDEIDRFYRFAYLAHFSFNKLRRGTMPDKHIGVEARFIDRLEKFAPRLKQVIVRSADYEDVLDEFDAPDAFFFLDPPYPGYEAEVGHDDWDEARFAKALRRLDGRFLVTYGTRSDGTDELFKGFHVERWRHTSGVGAHQGQGAAQERDARGHQLPPAEGRRRGRTDAAAEHRHRGRRAEDRVGLACRQEAARRSPREADPRAQGLRRAVRRERRRLLREGACRCRGPRRRRPRDRVCVQGDQDAHR